MLNESIVRTTETLGSVAGWTYVKKDARVMICHVIVMIYMYLVNMPFYGSWMNI